MRIRIQEWNSAIFVYMAVVAQQRITKCESSLQILSYLALKINSTNNEVSVSGARMHTVRIKHSSVDNC